MSQLDTANTFLPGDTVDAAKMNNIVDQASALSGLVQDQVVLEPATIDAANDRVLVYSAAATALRRAKVSALQTGVASVALTMPSGFAVVNLLPGGPAVTLTVTATASNRKVFAAPLDGTNGPVTMRNLGLLDITPAPVSIAATTIDWTLGFVFGKSLVITTNNLSFANMIEGQTIKVALVQQVGGATVGWTDPVRWRNGITPVMTPSVGKIDIFTFLRVSGNTFGYADQNF